MTDEEIAAMSGDTIRRGAAAIMLKDAERIGDLEARLRAANESIVNLSVLLIQRSVEVALSTIPDGSGMSPIERESLRVAAAICRRSSESWSVECADRLEWMVAPR